MSCGTRDQQSSASEFLLEQSTALTNGQTEEGRRRDRMVVVVPVEHEAPTVCESEDVGPGVFELR